MSMTPLERVMARLYGLPVDRVPNLSILMTFAAKYIGKSYDQYVRDYRILVEGNLRCCQDFQIDMLSAISDPMRETHAFGAQVAFPSNGVPYSPVPFIITFKDLEKLSIKDPLNEVRLFDRVQAIELYKNECAQEYPILGWVEGAFAEACDLHGITETMNDLYESPEFLIDLLEICTHQAIIFAESQIEFGADFIGIGDAAASLISPKMYQKFVLPYEKRIIDAIHAKGAKAKLHICGNITALLPYLTETKADMIDVDYPVNFSSAIQVFGSTISACGNFEPSEVLFLGDPGWVKEAVKNCMIHATNNTMIAPGCEVPRDTPVENLKAISKTLWEIAENHLDSSQKRSES